MPSIQLRLITTIKKLRNKELMHLYLQLMEKAEQYAISTKIAYMQRVYEIMQKHEEHVKLLDMKLNVPSETVKGRNELHKNIKNTFQHIRLLLKSNELTNSVGDRASATYALGKLEDLIDWKKVAAIGNTFVVINRIKQTIEDDIKLANALMDLDMLKCVAFLYTLGEEFEQLDIEKNIEGLLTPVINKTAIRKWASSTIKLLFSTIEIYQYLTEDDVWVEMAEEVKELAGEAMNDK